MRLLGPILLFSDRLFNIELIVLAREEDTSASKQLSISCLLVKIEQDMLLKMEGSLEGLTEPLLRTRAAKIVSENRPAKIVSSPS